jgi:hypothetical protein
MPSPTPSRQEDIISVVRRPLCAAILSTPSWTIPHQLMSAETVLRTASTAAWAAALTVLAESNCRRNRSLRDSTASGSTGVVIHRS